MIIVPSSGLSQDNSKGTKMAVKDIVMDNPPAYSDYDEPTDSGSVQSPVPPPKHHGHQRDAHSHPRHSRDKAHDQVFPNPSADQVHIFDRKNDIKGSFYIDPLITLLDSARIKKRKGKGKNKSKQLPHASFRTRHNAITLDLATTGDASKAPKANISVSNISKDIKINLLPTPTSKPSVGLDVYSRQGNTVLFVPEGFSGVVHMTTRRGTMQVLPALATYIKIVKHSEHETLFMIGAQDTADHSREASFCQLETRTGNIVVGLMGRDQYTPQGGFWQRLFRGSSSSSK